MVTQDVYALNNEIPALTSTAKPSSKNQGVYLRLGPSGMYQRGFSVFLSFPA